MGEAHGVQEGHTELQMLRHLGEAAPQGVPHGSTVQTRGIRGGPQNVAGQGQGAHGREDPSASQRGEGDPKVGSSGRKPGTV